MDFSCGCGRERAVPSSPPAGARGAKDSRCELGPGRRRDTLPRRPPPQTQGIRRVLRLRGTRVRTTHTGVPVDGRNSRRQSLSARDLGSAPRRKRRGPESRPPAPSGDLPAGARGPSFLGPRTRNSRASALRAGVVYGAARGLSRRGGESGAATAPMSAPSAPARAVSGLLVLYKRFLSPLLPRACRFEPTCSAYARQAIERHGLGRGGALAVKRLLKCQPFHRGGFDPVP